MNVSTPLITLDVESTSQLALQRIKGSAFLYPLRATWLTYSNEEDRGSDAIYMGAFSELFKSDNKNVLCLQVWVHSPECENWAGHGESWLKGRFPNYLPIQFFLGKKEGDEVEFSCPSQKKYFSITCQQLGSRYEEKGRHFEDMMEDMFMVTYNNLLDKYNAGQLNEEELEHWQIADKIKQEYFPNSIITNRGMVKNCIVQ